MTVRVVQTRADECDAAGYKEWQIIGPPEIREPLGHSYFRAYAPAINAAPNGERYGAVSHLAPLGENSSRENMRHCWRIEVH